MDDRSANYILSEDFLNERYTILKAGDDGFDEDDKATKNARQKAKKFIPKAQNHLDVEIVPSTSNGNDTTCMTSNNNLTKSKTLKCPPHWCTSSHPVNSLFPLQLTNATLSDPPPTKPGPSHKIFG